MHEGDWLRMRVRGADVRRPEWLSRESTRFVGLHATSEEAFRSILAMKRLVAGSASYGPYIFCKGYMADTSGGAGARESNRWHLQNALSFMRERSGKHASGMVVELGMYGLHRRCRVVADEWAHAGRPGVFTSVKDFTGTRWTMPEESAGIVAVWVDLRWAVEDDPVSAAALGSGS